MNLKVDKGLHEVEEQPRQLAATIDAQRLNSAAVYTGLHPREVKQAVGPRRLCPMKHKDLRTQNRCFTNPPQREQLLAQNTAGVAASLIANEIARLPEEVRPVSAWAISRLQAKA